MRVYETKSIRVASELLTQTPSSISQSIKELSRQLGIPLFNRAGRGLTPTSEADTLYPIIKKSHDKIVTGVESVKTFDTTSAGIIRIVTTSYFAGYYLAERVARFHKIYPNIKFDISHQTLARGTEILKRHEADILFSLIPAKRFIDKDIDIINIETFEQSFFTTKDFALKNNLSQTISKEKFDTLPFIAIRSYQGYIDGSVREPDIVVDVQDVCTYLLSNIQSTGFGIKWAIKKLFADNTYFFSVDGLEPKDAILACMYPKGVMPKKVASFIKALGPATTGA